VRAGFSIARSICLKVAFARRLGKNVSIRLQAMACHKLIVIQFSGGSIAFRLVNGRYRWVHTLSVNLTGKPIVVPKTPP
jgi:hypothetical protein